MSKCGTNAFDKLRLRYVDGATSAPEPPTPLPEPVEGKLCRNAGITPSTSSGSGDVAGHTPLPASKLVFHPFSNWKNHDSYTLAFDRLIRDLKAELE